ncbi:MAG: hypothetical protein WCK08_02215 [Betaproteobacteria bacterium]
MATPQQVQQLHKLIWTLIYGGLLCLLLGWSVDRLDPSLGRPLMVGGVITALIGVILIFVRARLKVGPAPRQDKRS